jgi:hypothetical protein
MPEGPSVRVLLFHTERPVSRAVIDWIADRQGHSRVIVPPSLAGLEALPPRARHEPFAAPGPDATRLAAEAAQLLAGAAPLSRVVVETACLALLEEGAVMVSGSEIFRDLVALSSWSMNVPERPTDGRLAQHLGIASRLPEAWRESAIESVEALLGGDPGRTARLVRERRLRARRDGPERFRRLGKTSAGLRPAVVYLDLLAAFSASGSSSRDWLGRLERKQAEALLSVAGAVFV